MTEEELFGRRLWGFMQYMDISPKKLASDSGVSINTIYNWMKGKTMPDIRQLKMVKKVLGCSWEELLGYE